MDGAEKVKESPRRPVSRCNEAFAEMPRRETPAGDGETEEESTKSRGVKSIYA